MNKYFYTDPLAAAWMAKHFGMKFTAHDGCELKWCREFSCYYHPNEAEYAGQCWDDKYYIHPDSINILDLKNDDHCTYEHYSTQLSSYGGSWEEGFMNWPPSPYGGCGYHTNDKNCRNLRIIQRGGIAFMQPDTTDQKGE